MRFLALWLPVLLCPIFLTPPVVHAQRSAQPAVTSARWTYDGAWFPKDRYGNPYYRYHVLLLERTVIVQSLQGNAVVAVDRTTGKELWRRVLPEQPSVPEMYAAGRADILIEPLAGDNRLQMQALDARTGKVLWRGPEGASFIHAYDGLIATLYDDKGPVTWLDAQTGKPILPRTATGKARFRTAAQRLKRETGSVTVGAAATTSPFSNPFELRILNFATGTSQRIGRVGINNMWMGDHLVSHISEDSGEVGASGRPTYVRGDDREGKPLWQYPRQIPTNDIGMAAANTQIYSAVPIRSANILAVKRDGFPGWIGLDARTGAALWQSAPSQYGARDVTVQADNLWVLGSLPDSAKNPGLAPAVLEAYEGRTGKRRVQIPVAEGWYFAMDADTAVVFVRDNKLRCYPLSHD